MLGGKNAIFLPFERLHFIHIESEEDQGYVEHYKKPHYQGRDMARMLGHMHQALCLLSSPAPSLESHWNAKHTHKYAAPRNLNKYPNNITTIHISSNNQDNTPTKKLKESISNALKNKEKILCIHPQKDYASYVYCQACGFLPRCPTCNRPWHYNLSKQSLVCHTCQDDTPFLPTCQQCQATNIKAKGVGIEKIQEILSIHFPKAKITLTQNAKQTNTILKQLKSIDILVTTPQRNILWRDNPWQRILIWNLEDCLAQSQTFETPLKVYQWMVQLRHQHPQTPFFIQTNTWQSALARALRLNKVDDFYAEELNNRALLNYPPYSRLLSTQITSANQDTLTQIRQKTCLLYTSPSPRDRQKSRMPSSA